MAPQDGLSPAGSSTYSSNTMFVGDGTWDSTRNDFLLPNLVGLNFETMRYNGMSASQSLSVHKPKASATTMEPLLMKVTIGMGNRFAGVAEYHTLVKGHGIVAVITFLFIVPAAIMYARFFGRDVGRARHVHIYLNVMALLLSTVVLVLGWFAVGPARSLTNPHHGLGVAIYVLMWVQSIGGRWVYGRVKARAMNRLPLTGVLHQWVGRATALLGIIQIPLGLTLYGSPKFTFILYTLWMTVLLFLYFVFSYRAQGSVARRSSSVHHGTVIEEKKKSRFGGWLAPLAAGAGTMALLSWRRNRKRKNEERDEVVASRRGSRRGSGSYIEEEKYEVRKQKDGGGIMSTVIKGAAVVGAGALAKSWWDRRQEKKKQEEYASVAPDTPSKRHRRHDSVSSDDSEETHRLEEGRRHGRHSLPGPVDAAAAAAAISAAERPITPRPARHHRTYSHGSESGFTQPDPHSPSRRPQSPSHAVRNSIIAGLGMGALAKWWKDRSDKKEQERLDKLAEEERLARLGHSHGGSRFTGDGIPPPRRHRVSRTQESSELSSIIDDPHHIRPGDIPPIPAALAGGAAGGIAAAALAGHSRSHHDMPTASAPPPPEHANYPPPPPGGPPPGHTAYAPPHSGLPPGSDMGPATMPPTPHDPVGILHDDSGTESYLSAGAAPHRRHSSRRRREGEVAAAAAVAGAAGLAAEQAARRRSRSRSQSQGPSGPSQPVSVKVKMHGDRNQKVTLRRLTEQEAAAEREARRNPRRRADSMSSLSGSETTASNPRRYRRDERKAERVVQGGPPPSMPPLSPPNPAFAGGKRPKDSAYYSGRPEGSGTGPGGPGSVGSPSSHGTWSGVSPSGSGDPAERRRRRRLERNQRPSGTVEFS